MSKNIEMNYKISDGYEVIYPQVQIQNVINLQESLDSKLSINGGTMTGPLILGRNPQEQMEAVNLGYLDIFRASIGWEIIKSSTYTLRNWNVFVGKVIDSSVISNCIGLIFDINVTLQGNSPSLFFSYDTQSRNAGIQLITSNYNYQTEVQVNVKLFYPVVSCIYYQNQDNALCIFDYNQNYQYPIGQKDMYFASFGVSDSHLLSGTATIHFIGLRT